MRLALLAVVALAASAQADSVALSVGPGIPCVTEASLRQRLLAGGVTLVARGDLEVAVSEGPGDAILLEGRRVGDLRSLLRRVPARGSCKGLEAALVLLIREWAAPPPLGALKWAPVVDAGAVAPPRVARAMTSTAAAPGALDAGMSGVPVGGAPSGIDVPAPRAPDQASPVVAHAPSAPVVAASAPSSLVPFASSAPAVVAPGTPAPERASSVVAAPASSARPVGAPGTLEAERASSGVAASATSMRAPSASTPSALVPSASSALVPSALVPSASSASAAPAVVAPGTPAPERASSVVAAPVPSGSTPSALVPSAPPVGPPGALAPERASSVVAAPVPAAPPVGAPGPLATEQPWEVRLGFSGGVSALVDAPVSPVGGVLLDVGRGGPGASLEGALDGAFTLSRSGGSVTLAAQSLTLGARWRLSWDRVSVDVGLGVRGFRLTATPAGFTTNTPATLLNLGPALLASAWVRLAGPLHLVVRGSTALRLPADALVVTNGPTFTLGAWQLAATAGLAIAWP